METSLLLLAVMLVIPVVMSAVNYEDQNNYYSPDPHPPTPTASHTPPAHGSQGGGILRGTLPPVNNCGNSPSGGHHHHTPPSPPRRAGAIVGPPTTTVPGTTPPTTIPSPPFSFDPNSPPFNCSYWRNHPTLIWGLFGWWGTVGNAFGVSSLPGYGTHEMKLLEALSNTNKDGFGQLYREGTAALLNSMADANFPYTSTQVRDSFVAALGSNKAAAAQARLFQRANQGR